MYLCVLFCCLSIISSNILQVYCHGQYNPPNTNDEDLRHFGSFGMSPGMEFYHSHRVYGTPLLLENQDFTLWIILAICCGSVLFLSIGIIFLYQYIRHDPEYSEMKNETYNNPYFNEFQKIYENTPINNIYIPTNQNLHHYQPNSNFPVASCCKNYNINTCIPNSNKCNICYTKY
ncbi:uncharacterized protein CMU_042660 [Cryptosporidium muris RN66]|uniref:Uncharacterized protein n=1 Tax=Cryptosporidium muris (strain RN66) TaxID=441375 RepID=B6AAF1_CRYMR|nr:uncharacterized protein CMU_042660 [Cryptosporidium muris RN66]EEA05192.1 hypothetical protein, conserved [Cryptosporidium muris RN66]|eukprot:XP_002139541.1 hypothetical protein [Cryptosporidium muris RN66]